MVIHLIHFFALWIHAFPEAQGIYEILSPRENFTQISVTYGKYFNAVFGLYIEAHCELDMTNTMNLRTWENIVLGPTGNIQGSLFVFDLNTGRVSKSINITVIPMPDLFINKFDAWGRRAQKGNSNIGLKFLNITKEKYDWGNG